MRGLCWALFALLVALFVISLMPTLHLQLLGFHRDLEPMVAFFYPRDPRHVLFPAGLATQLALAFAALAAARATSAQTWSWFPGPRPAVLLQHWRPILAALVLVLAGLAVYHALHFWFGFAIFTEMAFDWSFVQFVMMTLLPVLVAISAAAFLFCRQPGHSLRFIGLAAAALTVLQLFWMGWILLFGEVRPGFPRAFSWVQFFTSYSLQMEIATVWLTLQLAQGENLRNASARTESAPGPIACVMMAAWIISLCFSRLIDIGISGTDYPILGRMAAVVLTVGAGWLALGALINACAGFGGLRGAEPAVPPSRAALSAALRGWAKQIRPGLVALLAFAALAPLLQLLGMLWWIRGE